MMKRVILIAIILSVAAVSCKKNPFWVGNKEFITFEYTNNSNGPQVSDSETDISPFLSFENIYAQNIGNGTIEVVVDGVRVQSDRNNFNITKYEIYEKDGNNFELQSEFDQSSSSYKNDIGVVLVLDMSTSLSNLYSKLKSYAKNFVDEVVNSTENSVVAVVFFSGKDNIYSTGFYDRSNASTLKEAIDLFDVHESRTALFDASLLGIRMLDNLNYIETKALVVFTDGGDNDSDNPSQKVSEINSSEYNRISIGLEGDDFDKDDLESIASSKSNAYVVKKEKNLQQIFEKVGKQVVSVYRIAYQRSDQLLDNFIEIKIEFEVDKI